MKTIEEMISVMESYKEGKTIQINNVGMGDWEDLKDPDWDWGRYDYRVKPEPKIRPYANAKEFVDAMRKHGYMIEINTNIFVMPYKATDDFLWLSDYGVFEYLYIAEHGVKWIDGTPCGIEEGGNV